MMTCIDCQTALTDVHFGAGDGTGQRFRCEGCHRLHRVFFEVREELRVAREVCPPMPTDHDGWAVIKEELDELWEVVRRKPSARSRVDLYNEAKQVAAMALRFMIDRCPEVR